MFEEIEYTDSLTMEKLVEEVNWRMGQMQQNQQIFNDNVRRIDLNFQLVKQDIIDMKEDIKTITSTMVDLSHQLYDKPSKNDLKVAIDEIKAYIDSKFDK